MDFNDSLLNRIIGLNELITATRAEIKSAVRNTATFILSGSGERSFGFYSESALEIRLKKATENAQNFSVSIDGEGAVADTALHNNVSLSCAKGTHTVTVAPAGNGTVEGEIAITAANLRLKS